MVIKNPTEVGFFVSKKNYFLAARRRFGAALRAGRFAALRFGAALRAGRFAALRFGAALRLAAGFLLATAIRFRLMIGANLMGPWYTPNGIARVGEFTRQALA